MLRRTYAVLIVVIAAACHGGRPIEISSSPPATAVKESPANAVVAWPGNDDVRTVDGNAVFGGNLSGLTYEGAHDGRAAALWALRNNPGVLYRLTLSGATWAPDAADGWNAGKRLHYGDGSGNPDAEGVTLANGEIAGVYVSTERNNDPGNVSRNAILRFDPSQTGTTLNALNDWNLTSDLPAVEPNLGIETMTWVPDAFLVARKFFDETAGHTYKPSEHPGHGDGLFFVGLEANGNIYGYALNHTNNTFKRIAAFSSGFTGVMALEFDRELGYFWAVCDDNCNGQMNVLEIDPRSGSATAGRFIITHRLNRPVTMPNLNNEGFAFAPQSECVNGRKPAFWADDSETGGHSIRTASLSCSRF